MRTSNKKMKKVLWLEDQYEDLMDYSSRLGRKNYLVDPVKSVSESLKKLKKEEYEVYIFDLKVLPGDDPEWLELDEKKRKENPKFDPYLGLELLRFLDRAKHTQSELWKKIKFDFSKVILFSVVYDKKVYEELESFGIPPHQIVYKSGSTLDTLPELIVEIQDEDHE
jgi:CheY-like chemotaxis protein